MSFFSKIGNWITKPIRRTIKKRLLSVLFSHIHDYLDGIRHPTLQRLARIVLNRIKDIAPFFFDSKPNRPQIRAYIKDHKVPLIQDIWMLQRCLLEEELNDPKLVSILKRHSKELEQYTIQRKKGIN